MLAPSPPASESLGLLIEDPRNSSPCITKGFVHRWRSYSQYSLGHHSPYQARYFDGLKFFFEVHALRL